MFVSALAPAGEVLGPSVLIITVVIILVVVVPGIVPVIVPITIVIAVVVAVVVVVDGNVKARMGTAVFAKHRQSKSVPWDRHVLVCIHNLTSC